MIRCLLLVSVLSTLLFHSSTPAGEFDWPQWRGPGRAGISRESGLLNTWPTEGPRRVWLFRYAGVGYAGPAVVGDKLFIMGTRDDAECLFSLHAETGEELWVTQIGPIYQNNWGNGPRGTPTVVDDVVYALGAQGNLVAAQIRDGAILWQKSMVDQLGGSVPSWGYSESVLADGNSVVCTPGGKKGAIAKLDNETGQVLWQSDEFTDGAQYSSIIAAQLNGQRQYIQLTMEHLTGISATDGKLLWQTDWPGRTAVCATPIYHNGHVYITSSYGAGCKLVRIDGANNVEEVYANKNMKNHHGGVVRLGDYLYGYSDGVGWTCQNLMSGEIVWNDKQSLGKGCLTCADGKFYCLGEGDGSVALIDASPEGWKEHGRFTLDPQTEFRKPSGRIWTHPVIANGRLYLRDQDLIYCYDVKEER